MNTRVETSSRSEVENAFEKWLSERPKWLQTAAARILITGKPAHEEIVWLADLCIVEATKNKSDQFDTVPLGSFSLAITGKQLRIEKLSKVCGVNAIKDNGELDFGQANLSVIYGTNGAGKSGFTRLLKHACGARHKNDLLPNVFLNTFCPPPSACISISEETQKSELEWSTTIGGIAKLKNTRIFDTQTAETYVNDKNESTYEPRKMRFISALIYTSDQVLKVLGERKSKFVKMLPEMPSEFSGTDAMKFFTKLTAKTTVSNVVVACNFTGEELDERLLLEKTLNQTDYQQRIKELNDERKRLATVSQEMKTLFEGLSIGKLTEVVTVRIDAHGKRKAANEDADKIFANDDVLRGVGQASWRLLWDQARAYSEALAYPTELFPVTKDDAKCVLCHQHLDANAKARLDGFENFVKQGLDASATTAEQYLKRLLTEVPIVPAKNDWNLKLSLLKLDEEVQEQLFSCSVPQ